MQIRRAFIFCSIFGLSMAAVAGGFSGALGGLGEAMQNIGAQQQAADDQKELIELNHQREMERMRYQFEMQRRAQDAELQRQDAARQNANATAAANEAARAAEMERSKQYLDKMHPGWRQLVSSKQFKKWEVTLPDAQRQEFATTRNVNFVSDILWQYKATLKR